MKRLLPLIFLPLASPTNAEEIRWTASGTVTTVSAGFGAFASVGNPVLVKFSYQTGASLDTSSFLTNGEWSYAKTEFYGNIGLTMEVTIGSSTWKGQIPTCAMGGTLALLTDAWDGPNPADTADVFTALASSADSGTFSPFPYTGSNTARGIQVVLRDNTPPAEFIPIATLPDETSNVGSITAGSGFVSAGVERVNFTLNPASVAVTKDAPPIPLKISHTLTGIELRWPSETGVTYRLEEGDSLTTAGWTAYDTYTGSGSEIVVSLNPFNNHPTRRFYRVVTE
jgi:hypothetical protein